MNRTEKDTSDADVESIIERSSMITIVSKKPNYTVILDNLTTKDYKNPLTTRQNENTTVFPSTSTDVYVSLSRKKHTKKSSDSLN
ncbi:hypothetical protein CAEBREN_30788 [Caenorhabditis brenneri]|uniref:Uncharacterized protein n=1 Tax=Caenorhabditis brenneri TaxID=135651 RepID=G0MIR2_CAEBE|nr:hypothetical protein CAEBREN_30788 [Caenorhabditis brenneri]